MKFLHRIVAVPSIHSLALPAEELPFGPGCIIDGTYEILEVIGEGGMGFVMRARALKRPPLGLVQAGDEVALKVLTRHGIRNQAELKRVMGEIVMASRAIHANIAAYLDHGIEETQDGNYPYLVTELIDGVGLDNYLENHPQGLPLAEAFRIIKRIAKGLHYLHSQSNPIVHKDLKLSNVMLLPDGAVKLLDFGIASFASKVPFTATTQLGTIGYAAPEQYRKKSAIDVRADIHALGVILFELVNGPVDWDGITGHFLHQALTQKSRSRRLAFHPSVPIEVQEVILQATHPDPAQRFASVREFIDALKPAFRSPSKTEFDYTTLLDISVRRWRTADEWFEEPYRLFHPFDFVFLSPAPWIQDAPVEGKSISRRLELQGEELTYHRAAVRWLMMSTLERVRWSGRVDDDMPRMQNLFSALPGMGSLSLSENMDTFRDKRHGGFRLPGSRHSYRDVQRKFPYLRIASNMIEDKLLKKVPFAGWVLLTDGKRPLQLAEIDVIQDALIDLIRRAQRASHHASNVTRFAGGSMALTAIQAFRIYLGDIPLELVTAVAGLGSTWLYSAYNEIFRGANTGRFKRKVENAVHDPEMQRNVQAQTFSYDDELFTPPSV